MPAGPTGWSGSWAIRPRCGASSSRSSPWPRARTVLISAESGTAKEVSAGDPRSVRGMGRRFWDNCGHERVALGASSSQKRGASRSGEAAATAVSSCRRARCAGWISEISPRVAGQVLRVCRSGLRAGGSSMTSRGRAVWRRATRPAPGVPRRVRQDLSSAQRLPFHIPALRDRAEDVPALGSHFVR